PAGPRPHRSRPSATPTPTRPASTSLTPAIRRRYADNTARTTAPGHAGLQRKAPSASVAHLMTRKGTSHKGIKGGRIVVAVRRATGGMGAAQQPKGGSTCIYRCRNVTYCDG